MKWFIFSICLLISIVIGILVLSENANFVNTYFYDHFVYRNDFLTGYFKVITFIADTKMMIILCGLSLITLLFKKRYAIYLVAIMMASAAINQGLKYLCSIPRPIDCLVKVTGYSFPSGHTMGATSFFGYVIWLVVNSNLSKKKKWIISGLLTFIIINVGYSRIYLGAHYLTDVICGILISVCILIIGITLVKKYGRDVF